MQELDFLRSVRLIPAHAGKTLLSTGLPCRWRAHPRSRGENGSSTCWKPYHVGSSPLTQGKPPTSLPRGATRRAHPRSRGENDVYPQAERSVTGSSPLTQGKRLNRQSTELVRGFIPAHAGKTSRSRPPRGSRAAHPHSRGENGTALTAAINPTGSSPLTRGKHGARGGRGPGNGLIPAHAGKLFRVPGHAAALGRIPAHAGEIKADAITNYLYFGSTPLTRGKLNLRSRNNQRLGLIPTHARKTARAPPSYQ